MEWKRDTAFVVVVVADDVMLTFSSNHTALSAHSADGYSALTTFQQVIIIIFAKIMFV